jgi:DNA-binding NarL/FixJ family response regulator
MAATTNSLISSDDFQRLTTEVLRNDRQHDELTSRELEVLKYMAAGHSTKKVPWLLGIAFKTAQCHRYRLMDKLNIHDTASLVRYAIRNDIIEA